MGRCIARISRSSNFISTALSSWSCRGISGRRLPIKIDRGGSVSGAVGIACLALTVPPIVHGRVEAFPATLGALDDQFQRRGAALIEGLADQIRGLCRSGRFEAPATGLTLRTRFFTNLFARKRRVAAGACRCRGRSCGTAAPWQTVVRASIWLVGLLGLPVTTPASSALLPKCLATSEKTLAQRSHLSPPMWRAIRG
jgi:hypothetical protein